MAETVFMYCGAGTTVKTWIEGTRYYTSVHNQRYSETPIIVCFTDNPSLVRGRHDYWVRRMSDTKLPPYLIHLSPERDLTVWRKDVSDKPEVDKQIRETTPQKKIQEVPYDISKEFLLIPRFGCKR